jgi:hypothetical protein
VHDIDTRTAALRLSREGHSVRAIARALRISRGAVDRILASGIAEVPVVERPDQLEPHLDQVRDLFVRCRGNLVRVHEELAAAGVLVPYSTLTGFCRRHHVGESPKQAAGQYHFEPGEEMQHDTSPHKVTVGGRLRSGQCASLILCYSRRVYAQCYPRWTRFHVRSFLAEALVWFGGSAGRAMVDNLSVIIAHGTGRNAVPAPEMAAFAERFGFDFAAHELGDVNRSARVERPFDYIERNFYPGRTFSSWDDLNAQLRDWCTRVDHRHRRSLQASPIELFAAEQACLRPLPLHVPEVYDLHVRSVDLEGYVHLHVSRYSVPEGLIGEEVEVRESLARVRFLHRHQVVAEHRRRWEDEPGNERLPEHRRRRRKAATGLPPTPEESVLRANAPELVALVEALRKHHGGRAVHAIRRLHRMFLDYPTEPLVSAVRSALEYGLLDLERIESLVLRRISGDFFRQPVEARRG